MMAASYSPSPVSEISDFDLPAALRSCISEWSSQGEIIVSSFRVGLALRIFGEPNFSPGSHEKAAAGSGCMSWPVSRYTGYIK